MKAILSIPVVIAKAVADVLFGFNDITEEMRQQQARAQLLMIMGRTH
ncbi:MAG TPA: hypothetical protein VNT75_23745 [Symbiobacteriaceae bacterium]|nr:hypothetical protein [Symbiobacteriaceae bacterium]